MSAVSHQPPGTFLPNTKVTCGTHKVYIDKYLSEGGFAHVYVVRIPREHGKHELAVLKRVAVPDKEHLASMRTEVETMKKLSGHKHIVTYIDSHASQLKGGGYEVFLLMEYCSGGGLIDFMNTRLHHRLTEPEILKIFGDCAEGVACMHYLSPPLLHRDLKVENVLISKTSTGSPSYKICDFGSTAPPRPAAKSVEEGRLIEEDVQKHTTVQYRSPEMIDVWRKQPIDEKADIWALGVLLYKLCYYITPFEDVGQMAILNATFKYPSHPVFSDRLKKLISWMLKENPQQRPNIYQVLKEVCSMCGKPLPIKDIYAGRTQSEARRNESLPSRQSSSSAPVGLRMGATESPTVAAIPDVAPMRRGRPGASLKPGADTPPVSAKPTPSPARGDPFAALDSKNYNIRAGAVDELSQRFPSLDDFSIAHDGGTFAFPKSSTPASPPSTTEKSSKGTLNERVAQALADEVFATKSSLPSTRASLHVEKRDKQTVPSGASSPKDLQKPSSVQPTRLQKPLRQPEPMRGDVVYRSTATGSSPPLRNNKPLGVSTTPIWRVPEADRFTGQSRAITGPQTVTSISPSPVANSGMLQVHDTKTRNASQGLPNSSRPSLEGGRPRIQEPEKSEALSRTETLTTRSRPSSMYLDSNIDFLRDHERTRPSLDVRRISQQHSRGQESGAEENAIEDDIDYLRRTEGQDGAQRKSMKEAMKLVGHHRKRSSFDAIRSGTRNILGGKFGDAFKRFEQSETRPVDNGLATPEALQLEQPQPLSPISGSEATPSKESQPDLLAAETEDLPQDVRREMERRALASEEDRFAEAAAEYRAKLAIREQEAPLVSTKASTIQRRVQSLLDEGRQSSQHRKTAEGYGRYTDNDVRESAVAPTQVDSVQFATQATTSKLPKEPRQASTSRPMSHERSVAPTAPSDLGSLQRNNSRPGPSAPPKPKALRTGTQVSTSQPSQTDAPKGTKPPRLAALLAKDLEGVPDYPERMSNSAKPHAPPSRNTLSDDNELDSFSKRYPSLSGLEMVETEIGR